MFWKGRAPKDAFPALINCRRRGKDAKQNGADPVRAVIKIQSLTTEMSGASTAFMPTT